MDHFKVFIDFGIILLLFYVLITLALRHVDLSSPARIEPEPSALEGEVLSTSLPRKSLNFFLVFFSIMVYHRILNTVL